MKKYFTIILLVFLTNFSYSQFGAKYEEVQVTLKKGSVVNGFGRVSLYYLDFKDSDKKNHEKIDFLDIDKVKFTVYSGKKNAVKNDFVLASLQLEKNSLDKKKYVLAELIVEKEKIKIYGVYALAGGGFSMGPGLGGQVSVVNFKGNFNPNSYADYYCYLNNEAIPRLMYEKTNAFKTFRVMASECFKDCEELSKKINKKEFTTENIFEIANYYNDKCK
jgi:hypothetical protein